MAKLKCSCKSGNLDKTAKIICRFHNEYYFQCKVCKRRYRIATDGKKFYIAKG